MITSIFSKFTSSIYLYFAQTACTLPGDGEDPFFAFPHWWKYLEGRTTSDGACVPYVDLSTGFEPLWGIGLAIVEILLRVAGFLAIFYIIFAGYVYIRSTGNAEMAANAQKKLVSAIVGLLIVLIAIALVTFIGSSLT